MVAGSRILKMVAIFFTTEGISLMQEFGQYSKSDIIMHNTELSSSSLFFHIAAVNELQLFSNSISRFSHKSMIYKVCVSSGFLA